MSAMPPDRGLLDHLIGIARSLAGEAGLSGARAPTVLWDRPDGLVVRLGEVVVKAHAPDTDPGDFAARLRVASSPLLRGVLLPPLLDPPLREARGRLITAWPAGDPVSPEDPDAAPWEDAARLLARLHSTPLAALTAGGPLPRMGGPGRVARAMARLRAAAADRTPAKAAVASVASVASVNESRPPTTSSPRPSTRSRSARAGPPPRPAFVRSPPCSSPRPRSFRARGQQCSPRWCSSGARARAPRRPPGAPAGRRPSGSAGPSMHW